MSPPARKLRGCPACCCACQVLHIVPPDFRLQRRRVILCHGSHTLSALQQPAAVVLSPSFSCPAKLGAILRILNILSLPPPNCQSLPLTPVCCPDICHLMDISLHHCHPALAPSTCPPLFCALDEHILTTSPSIAVSPQCCRMSAAHLTPHSCHQNTCLSSTSTLPSPDSLLFCVNCCDYAETVVATVAAVLSQRQSCLHNC